ATVDRWAAVALYGRPETSTARRVEQSRLSHPDRLVERPRRKRKARLRSQVPESAAVSAAAGRAAARVQDGRPTGDDAPERARCVQARGVPAQVHGQRASGMKGLCLLLAGAAALLVPGHGDAALSVGCNGSGVMGSKT